MFGTKSLNCFRVKRGITEKTKAGEQPAFGPCSLVPFTAVILPVYRGTKCLLEQITVFGSA